MELTQISTIVNLLVLNGRMVYVTADYVTSGDSVT